LETSKVTADTLRKLARYDTPTICNVIELFDVRPRNVGYMDGRIRAAFSELPPMVGFAATAAMRCASPTNRSTYDTLESQLGQFEGLAGPAVVVFQDLDDPPVAATFGEVMCSTYQAFGSVGIITSGGGRDLAQVRALNFPVFSASTICSHGYTETVEVGAPVRIGGLVIQSGDLLHGDCNGVTSIPNDIATEIADAAEEFVAAEAHVLEYVRRDGKKALSELIARRRDMTDAVAALRRRLSRGIVGKKPQ
jgi:4-hydroxy-4-methyl-2-oxoglutarate aldolase